MAGYAHIDTCHLLLQVPPPSLRTDPAPFTTLHHSSPLPPRTPPRPVGPNDPSEQKGLWRGPESLPRAASSSGDGGLVSDPSVGTNSPCRRVTSRGKKLVYPIGLVKTRHKEPLSPLESESASRPRADWSRLSLPPSLRAWTLAASSQKVVRNEAFRALAFLRCLSCWQQHNTPVVLGWAFELLIGEAETSAMWDRPPTTSSAHNRANDAALPWCLTYRSGVGHEPKAQDTWRDMKLDDQIREGEKAIIGVMIEKRWTSWAIMSRTRATCASQPSILRKSASVSRRRALTFLAFRLFAFLVFPGLLSSSSSSSSSLSLHYRLST
ncbi:hypothetical protein B0T20DRAFT_474416 [Sordaria brevicollis]|uniref:Uncharacterized protein n=1 Tax=Sordaria brevicollis TaxID=83679 RepID=A0AAE0UGK2_SORBR|nr:hypothetical protein B0T20DRAFT_474416 [Sordaria brevicollis]